MLIKKSNKRGNILTENLVFIILNIIFITILFLFIFRQGEGAVILEESYTKQIALLLDSAKPGMIIQLNMEKAISLAEKNKLNTDNIVTISGNIVTVKLSDKGGYSYTFFNNVNVNSYRDGDYYYFIIGEYS
jgi:hypothetical protein